MSSSGTHRLNGSLTPNRVSRDRRRFLSKLTARAGNWYPDKYPWTAEKESQSILECVRIVAMEVEMAKPGFAPVTPPKRVSMAPTSPVEAMEPTSPVEAPGIELDEDPAASVADGLQPGIGADEEALYAVASGILDEEGQLQEGLPDVMVLSPSKRLRIKAPSPMVPKRSQKYCQNEDCVFNRMVPGQPAQKEWRQKYCTWCDDDLLAKAVSESKTEMSVKQALRMFKEKSAHVYRLALEKLEGHELSKGSRWCNGTGCVYSMCKPGSKSRARTASDFCAWCEPEYLEIAKQTVEGRKRLNQALSAFKTNPQVYDAALAKVGEGFVRASHVCCNAACVFSYKAPGQRCMARRPRRAGPRVSDLCFWCSPQIVSRAESTLVGIRRITMDLRKFSAFPDVFKSAISKLSEDFVADLRIASREAEKRPC